MRTAEVKDLADVHKLLLFVIPVYFVDIFEQPLGYDAALLNKPVLYA